MSLIKKEDLNVNDYYCEYGDYGVGKFELLGFLDVTDRDENMRLKWNSIGTYNNKQHKSLLVVPIFINNNRVDKLFDGDFHYDGNKMLNKEYGACSQELIDQIDRINKEEVNAALEKAKRRYNTTTLSKSQSEKIKHEYRTNEYYKTCSKIVNDSYPWIIYFKGSDDFHHAMRFSTKEERAEVLEFLDDDVYENLIYHN